MPKLRTVNRFHRLPPVLAVMVAILCLLNLSACAGPGTPIPTVVPTLHPTADPNCPTLALENWLRNATANTDGFINLLNRSGGTKQADASQVASQLAKFEIKINTVAAPTCAMALNGQINIMMNDAVQAFMLLASDPRTAVQSAITQAVVRYSQIQNDQQRLLTLLNTQLGH